MLQLNNVNKTYRSKKGTDCKALRNVSLTLGEKGLTFLLGKSGSGKSTLLNIIGGLDKADSGEILYNGQSLQEFSANDLDNYRNVTVGFVFQEFNLLEQFNVYENIELVLKMQKLDFTPQDIENALERVGMQGYGKRAVSELSGGQKQRVAIARALLKQSKIILADEPTGNLDSETSAEIFELLKDISKEKLVIVVTHDRDSAEKYGDGIVEIKDGEIVKNTAPQESREAQESIKPTANKHKIPFVYKLRMALKNFGKHWVRSAITTLSIMLSLTVIVMSQVMGTKIVVMKLGIIQQVDSPTNLFDYPENKFVAGFIGTPQMNFFDVKIKKSGGRLNIKFANGEDQNYELANMRKINKEYLDGEEHEVTLGIRGENVRLDEKGLTTTLTIKEILGNTTQMFVKITPESADSIVCINERNDYMQGDTVKIVFDEKRIHLFDRQTELAIMGREFGN